MSSGPVLVSWVAVNNDPFERDQDSGESRLMGGVRVPGPTLTLLCDEESPYAGGIADVVLLHRASRAEPAGREQRAVSELQAVLRERSIRVHLEPWHGDDPTDHRAIFEFLRERLPAIRRRFAGRELVLHISPGTPSMHTIWVLMAETGFVDAPFVVVKSYRRSERRGRPAVVPVELNIETFYKAYKMSRPGQLGSEDQGVVWDPARFQSEAMKRVYREARRFAQLKVPILICGERGTGKTTMAVWIRSNSPFRRSEQDGRWPAVACGQYNPETMRAELFGYKKGSFTGATKDHPGLLAAAHLDTLFLDEVGDVSRDLQRLLIKAVEEKLYYAVGDDKPRESDFRLLSATNVDMQELQSRLDPDFLDRISLLTLELPALRDVREELTWLWEAVYAESTRRAGVPMKAAHLGRAHHERIVTALGKHPLPGNLRDLFRVSYRVLAARGDHDAPMSPVDAVEYGLDALRDTNANSASITMAKAVAAAFASNRALDGLLGEGVVLNTGGIFGELKAYVAGEIRRIAGHRKLPAAEICDVSDRSLRDWAQHISAERKNAAE